MLPSTMPNTERRLNTKLENPSLIMGLEFQSKGKSSSLQKTSFRTLLKKEKFTISFRSSMFFIRENEECGTLRVALSNV